MAEEARLHGFLDRQVFLVEAEVEVLDTTAHKEQLQLLVAQELLAKVTLAELVEAQVPTVVLVAVVVAQVLLAATQHQDQQEVAETDLQVLFLDLQLHMLAAVVVVAMVSGMDLVDLVVEVALDRLALQTLVVVVVQALVDQAMADLVVQAL